MTMMYRCDSCNQPIPQRQFVQITFRVLKSNENEEQDEIEQVYGDYCDGCIASGKAVESLVSELAIYKGLEADEVKA